MRFTKMQGAGNDFIVINNIEEQIPVGKLAGVAARLCSRRLSIGADGMMAVCPAEDGGDFRMLFYNSDGTLGEMCGNGARCICRYGFENGLAGGVQRVETTAGLVTGGRIDRRMYRVRLNDPTIMKPDFPVVYDGRSFDASYVELGDPGLPHCVVRFDGWDELAPEDLREMGRSLRYYSEFPKGANVTFVKVVSPVELKAVTYERGVEDFTLACGTGCGSTVAALALRGAVTGRDVRIAMPGGDLYVTVDAGNGEARNIYLTGPTNIVCVGEVRDEDLEY